MRSVQTIPCALTHERSHLFSCRTLSVECDINVGSQVKQKTTMARTLRLLEFIRQEHDRGPATRYGESLHIAALSLAGPHLYITEKDEKWSEWLPLGSSGTATVYIRFHYTLQDFLKVCISA